MRAKMMSKLVFALLQNFIFKELSKQTRSPTNILLVLRPSKEKGSVQISIFSHSLNSTYDDDALSVHPHQ
jgi:hypothetical protein